MKLFSLDSGHWELSLLREIASMNHEDSGVSTFLYVCLRKVIDGYCVF